MEERLSNPQIRKLKGMAQRMEATLKMGKSGLSDAFIQSASEELDRHELVKVKFVEFKEQRKELAPELARRTASHLVALVGHVAVLYRPNSSEEKRRIKF